jgi:hypothetical protein
LIAKWGIWAGLSVLVVAALLFGGVSNAVTSPPPPSTYTVAISEFGLPSGTSWSATFDGTLLSGTTSTLKYTGVTAGSYCYYPVTVAGSASTTQYTPGQNYCINVPSVERITVVYTTEYYTTFGVSPSGSGTINYGTNWYAAGSEIEIAAAATSGFTFSSWTPSAGITIASTTTESTELTMNAAGTVTADFNTGSYAANFYETGLPAATHWTLIFDSASKSSTTSTITTNSLPPAGYSWSIAPVTAGSTTEYVASPASGTVYLPSQLSQEIVFTKEYAVTFAVSGTGTITPASGFYASGSVIQIQATSASDTFSKWTTTASKVPVGSTADQGTYATVKAAGTVTAVFKTTKICSSKCSLTFRETGLPAGTGWGIEINSASAYPTTSSSLTLSSLSASYYYWAAFSPVSTGQYGVAYIPVGTTANYYYLGQTTSIEIVYEEVAYVTIATNPSYTYGGGLTQASGWYPINSLNPLSAGNGSYFDFASYSSSTSAVTLGSTTAASTTFTVTGPGSITANFVQPTVTLHFTEFGLPTGTTWGVSVDGQISAYYSSSTTSITVTGVPLWSYSLYPAQGITTSTGTEWNSPAGNPSLAAQQQTYQAFVYAQAVYVTFVTGPTGTSGGIYTPASGWYYVGSVLAMIAENGTGTNPTFKDWSDTTGTGAITTTSAASTFLTVAKTGTVTCTFK